jgi:hypothetical protein
MASEVDISNLALAHLGDSATVASLDPPEGSAQAEHCARFYPIARDGLLEMHAWGFSTVRQPLAQLSTTRGEWAYCYLQPNNVLGILAVLPSGVTDDYSENGTYTPVPFSAEVDELGNDVIYTNQVDAIVRYTIRQADTTKFSPLFVTALSWHLASMLAGPVIKGSEGSAESKRCSEMVKHWMGEAGESDANQRKITPTHNVTWMSIR